MEEIKETLAALGKCKADKVFKNAQILDVFGGHFYKGDIAVVGNMIVGVGDYDGEEEIDLKNKYVTPGFIDSHLHIESSLTQPQVFEKEVISHGTTVLIADPHEAANVKGTEALAYILDLSDKMLLHMKVMLPSCVPATVYEHNGACITAEDLSKFKEHPNVLGLGEVMDITAVCENHSEILNKIRLFQDKRIDGHSPLLTGKRLQCYVMQGISSDHESSCEQEVLEKLRAGLFIEIRMGSAAKNLDTIINTVLKNRIGTTHMGFCTDDKSIAEIREEGHIDACIRRAISLGLPPISAYQIATIQPAVHYGLQKLGAIAPGRFADFVVLDDVEKVKINRVYIGGKLYEKGGQGTSTAYTVPEKLKHTVHIKPVTKKDLAWKTMGRPQPVIEVIPSQIVTKKRVTVLPEEDGIFQPNAGISKIAVIERHKASGNIGIGAVLGFPIHGALASTIGHDSHNLIVVGDNDEDMLTAIEELCRMQGGYIVVQNQKTLASVPLPVFGLLSEMGAGETAEKVDLCLKAAFKIGCDQAFDPFATLSFLALTVIPEIRITDQGIYEVKS